MMAEKLDSFTFTNRRNAGSKYDKYFDGGIYRLVVGEDIPSLNPHNLYTLATKRGKKLRVQAEPDALVIQAYTPKEDR